jgi:hypothetical protein
MPKPALQNLEEKAEMSFDLDVFASHIKNIPTSTLEKAIAEAVYRLYSKEDEDTEDGLQARISKIEFLGQIVTDEISIELTLRKPSLFLYPHSEPKEPS